MYISPDFNGLSLYFKPAFYISTKKIRGSNKLKCIGIKHHSYLFIETYDDDLAHVAAAGANASGACMLCVPGTYQTGSGQMQG